MPGEPGGRSEAEGAGQGNRHKKFRDVEGGRAAAGFHRHRGGQVGNGTDSTLTGCRVAGQEGQSSGRRECRTADCFYIMWIHGTYTQSAAESSILRKRQHEVTRGRLNVRGDADEQSGPGFPPPNKSSTGSSLSVI